jgi:GxxExxY protein
MKNQDITDKILKAYYTVYNALGYGFLEKVYEKAMVIELRNMGVYVEAQWPVEVYFDGIMIGQYFADLVVADSIIVELKANEILTEIDEAQLLNYLKATEMEIGLLLNFGPKPTFKRKIFDNHLKKIRHNPS